MSARLISHAFQWCSISSKTLLRACYVDTLQDPETLCSLWNITGHRNNHTVLFMWLHVHTHTLTHTHTHISYARVKVFYSKSLPEQARGQFLELAWTLAQHSAECWEKLFWDAPGTLLKRTRKTLSSTRGLLIGSKKVPKNGALGCRQLWPEIMFDNIKPL